MVTHASKLTWDYFRFRQAPGAIKCPDRGQDQAAQEGEKQDTEDEAKVMEGKETDTKNRKENDGSHDKDDAEEAEEEGVRIEELGEDAVLHAEQAPLPLASEPPS